MAWGPSARLTSRAARIAALLGGLAALAAAAYWLRGWVPVEASAEAVRAMVADLGWWGPLVFVVLFLFRSVLVLPSVVLLTAGGICFGVLGGMLLGGAGLTLSAAFKWSIFQLLGRDRLLAALPVRLRRRLMAVDGRAGALLLGTATAYPIGPAELLHTAAILAGIQLLPFLLAVAAGSLVRAGSFSLFGDALADGRGLAVSLLALSAVAVLPLLVPRVRRALRAGTGGGMTPDGG